MTSLAGNVFRDPALLRRARRDAAHTPHPEAPVPAQPSDPKPESVVAKAKHAIGDSALLRRVRRGPVAEVSPASVPIQSGNREPRSVVAKAKHAIGDSALLRRVRRGPATASHPVTVVPVQPLEAREQLEPSTPETDQPTLRRGLLRVRSRFVRAPREAATAERVPVRHRVARAVGTAASAIPESRAVRVGTAVATVIAENQGILRAGLTAASAVPVLRPYVKVAVAATGAISVAHRVVKARRKAADVVSAFRARPEDNAGKGFGPDAAKRTRADAGDDFLAAAPRADSEHRNRPGDRDARGEHAAPVDLPPASARYANPVAYRAKSARPGVIPAQTPNGDAKPEEEAGR